MSQSSELSRRERQIMDSLYAREGATVAEVRDDLPNPPVNKAVRRMLHILEEKGYVTRGKAGKEYVYRPRETKKRAGVEALRHVLDTFFEGGKRTPFRNLGIYFPYAAAFSKSSCIAAWSPLFFNASNFRVKSSALAKPPA